MKGERRPRPILRSGKSDLLRSHQLDIRCHFCLKLRFFLRSYQTNSKETWNMEELSLKHRLLLDDRLKLLGKGLSEYCFSNLYLFRNTHNYHIICEDRIFLAGNTYDDHSFLMPLFDPAEVSAEYLLEKLAGYDFYFPVSEKSLSAFDSRLFSYSYNDDDSDYIVSAEKFMWFGGRKLAKKKNLMKQFLKIASPRVVPYDKTQQDAAEDVLCQWLEDVGKSVAETDFLPCQEALANHDIFNLLGFVFYDGSEPAGFMLGRELIAGMCVIHFAKGKRKYKGIFQYMINQFALNYRQVFDWYNIEQDLGNPNLRKTKHSYDPDAMLKKYRVAPL
ncbi:MAG: DUF2156 domain-containing protein [Deltaproteobacteria bacterium]|nr:DUF2156 domain-containing protein [Deltaproteobacteria bacterium]